MPLKLVKRKSDNWIIRGTVRGIRIEESTGTDRRSVAEEIRAKREAEILTQSIYGRPATATFAEAVVSYIEAGGRDGQGGDRRFLNPIVKHFGTTALAKIDQLAIDAAARKLHPRSKPSTVNRQVFTPIAAVLRHAAKRGLCPVPIIARPKAGSERIRYLTPDEAEKLISACSAHLRPLVIFLLYTGARAGEALWLDWQSIDLSRAHVSFERTKNGEARGVPLPPRVVAVLANLPDKNGRVFRRPDGEDYTLPKDASDTSAGSRIRTAFIGAVKRAGLTDFHPHDCRHTWATWHYAANRDLGALKRLGGWKSERMVLRYAHVNVGELAAGMGRLPGANIGEPAPSAASKAGDGVE